MRLKPPVSLEEALAYLVAQAKSTWDLDPSFDLEKALTPMAEALVAVSAADVPEEAEPLLL